MNLDGFIRDVGRWHETRFPDADARDIVLKLMSEVGELADAELGGELGGKGLTADEWADVMIVLCAYADRAGIGAAEVVAKWDRVRG